MKAIHKTCQDTGWWHQLIKYLPTTCNSCGVNTDYWLQGITFHEANRMALIGLKMSRTSGESYFQFIMMVLSSSSTKQKENCGFLVITFHLSTSKGIKR